MGIRTTSARRAFSLFFSKDALGYAFLRAWSASLFSSSILFAAFTDRLGWGSTAHSLSIAALVVSYFLMALGSRTVLFQRPVTVRRIGFAVTEMGTVLILIDLAASFGPSVLSMIGAVLTGIGSCVLALAWGRQFARLPNEAVFGTTLGSYLLTALFTLAFNACSQIALALLSALAPFASLLCFRSESNDGRSCDCGEPRRLPSDGSQRGQLTRMTAYVLLFSVTVGAIGAFNAIIAATYEDLSLFIIIALCAITALCLLLGMQISYGFILGFSTLVLAVFFLALPFLSVGFPLAALGMGGQLLGRIAVWTYLIYACKRLAGNPLLILGLGLGAHYTGLILGENYASYLISTIGDMAPTDLFVFSLISMFILVVSFLAGERALRQPLASGHRDSADPDESTLRDEELLRACAHKAALQFGLTEREEELLYYLTRGFSSRAIQERLYISASTVSSHSSNIYRKMDVHSKEEAGEVVRSMEPATTPYSAPNN